MSDIDGMAQVLKIEVEGMEFAVKTLGTSGVKIAQAFAKLIKGIFRVGKWGTGKYSEHKMKNIDKAAGEVTMDVFKEKYRGDSVEILEFHSRDDYDKFVNMCSKEGVAIVNLPDLNPDDDKFHIMFASSTKSLIQKNIEMIDNEKIQNARKGAKSEEKGKGVNPNAPSNVTEPETCAIPVSVLDYVHSSEGATDAEKEANFINNVDKNFFPSAAFEKVDISNNQEIHKFLENLSNDQRMILCESNNYKAFPISDANIIGETKDSVSYFLDGNQIDVDKSVLVKRNGKLTVYCPRNTEDAPLGKIIVNGKNINAAEFKNMISEVNKSKMSNIKAPKIDIKAPNITNIAKK